jgi:tRNA A22 N-methylase
MSYKLPLKHIDNLLIDFFVVLSQRSNIAAIVVPGLGIRLVNSLLTSGFRALLFRILQGERKGGASSPLD